MRQKLAQLRHLAVELELNRDANIQTAKRSGGQKLAADNVKLMRGRQLNDPSLQLCARLIQIARRDQAALVIGQLGLQSASLVLASA